MANGVVVPLKAVWKGEITIAGVKAEGEFEVFDSGGGWRFLFGKPLLCAFKAVHEYETDTVHITGKNKSRTIYNQSEGQQPSVEDIEEKIHVVEPILAEDTQVGGEDPPSREVLPIHTIPVCIYSDEGTLPDDIVNGMLDGVPTNFLEDEIAVFTRVTDLM
ncbi:hypothetical protein EV702DRAFT_1198505 [Suillus placidus]|uniref:Uncharacterized protein n=1 Tax=Suillus placidus TaxID=48579 RepID=A0A9P6ZTF8_9AGAM|nr:hypothetical protein EV702DRAFT_1198505 [Suillus placidus]